MQRYQYKVVPAPAKGTKAKGVKTPEGRFALSVEELLNQMGSEGWEYQRAELLPSEEKSGLTSSTTNWRNVLVFRRLVAGDAAPSVESLPRHQVVIPAAKPPAGEAPDRAPAAISQEAGDPPLSRPSAENTDEARADADTPRTPPFLSSRRGDETPEPAASQASDSTAEAKD